MTKLNQKEAVFSAVESFLGEQGKKVSESAVELSRSDKRTIIGMLATGLSEGQIEVSAAKQAKMTTDQDYREYASNILNNWVRKDLRLNGNKPYVTQKPGSRPSDPQVKELTKLLAQQTDDDAKAQVQAAIDKRVAELQAEKKSAKQEPINTDLIPAEFLSLVK